MLLRSQVRWGPINDLETWKLLATLIKGIQMVKIMIDGGSEGDEEEKLEATCTDNPFKIFWCEEKRKSAITGEQSGIKSLLH